MPLETGLFGCVAPRYFRSHIETALHLLFWRV
jgi:hypothetical protein